MCVIEHLVCQARCLPALLPAGGTLAMLPLLILPLAMRLPLNATILPS